MVNAKLVRLPHPSKGAGRQMSPVVMFGYIWTEFPCQEIVKDADGCRWSLSQLKGCDWCCSSGPASSHLDPCGPTLPNVAKLPMTSFFVSHGIKYNPFT